MNELRLLLDYNYRGFPYIDVDRQVRRFYESKGRKILNADGINNYQSLAKQEMEQYRPPTDNGLHSYLL